MTDLLEYIKKMQEMYGDDVITTADKLEKPPKTVVREMFEDFNARNPKADGGQLVAPSVDGSRPGYQGKDYIPGYNIKERIINEKKYQKVLTEMLNELDVMKEKGYGNVSNLVEKYSDKLGPTKGKTKKYYKADGSFGGLNWNTEQRKIRGAVIDAAKQADITDLPDNMIKAVEDYKKFKGKITRGETAKIIKANKVPESSLYKALNKVNAFVKQKKKYKNIDEKNKIKAAERRAALKKYSSDGFERMTKGSLTIQGGHTGDIYNEFVTPKTKKYTPAFINQETLKEYDALIKSIGEARDKAIKAKNFKEVERLNVKGMAVSAGSEGYKTFKVVQPDGSSYIYGIDDITTTDPMNLTKVDTVQELTKGKDVEFEKAKKLYKAKKISKAELEVARAAAEKRLFEAGTHRDLIKVQKKEAMKAAKLSKKDIKSLDKRLTKNLEKLGCGNAAGGRILMSNGGATLTKCARKGTNKLEQILLKGGANKNEQVLANSILRAGAGLKSMLSLRGMFGPAALAFTAAAEAGIVGYDMLAEGKTFKEAVGDSVFNYALGPKLKIDSIEERNKRFRKLGVSEKEMGKIAAFESALGDIDRIENIFTKDQTTKQKLEQAKKFFPAVVDKRQKEADAVRADIQDLARTGIEQRLMNVDYDAGAKALEEAKKLATIDRLTSRGPQIFGQIFPKAEKSRQQRILDASSIVNPAHNIPGMREATGGYLYGFASGGLANLTNTIPPESGPMSQGLRSLYNNGKKL